MNNSTHEAIDKIQTCVLNLTWLQNIPLDSTHTEEWKEGEVKRWFEGIREQADGVLGPKIPKSTAHKFSEERNGRTI